MPQVTGLLTRFPTHAEHLRQRSANILMAAVLFLSQVPKFGLLKEVFIFANRVVVVLDYKI